MNWIKTHAVASSLIALLLGLVLGAGASRLATDSSSPTVAGVSSSEVDDLRAENLYLESQIDELESGLAEDDTDPEPAETVADVGEPTIVASFEGDNETQTRDFTVDGTWELRYKRVGGNSTTPTVDILKSPNGGYFDDFDMIRSEGKLLFRKGGTFFFDIFIYTPCTWKLTVIDLPG